MNIINKMTAQKEKCYLPKKKNNILRKFSSALLMTIGFMAGLVFLSAYSASADNSNFEIPACAFEEQEGRTIVNFGDKKIVSHQSEEDASSGPVTVNMPAGTYKVSLFSYDGYESRAGASPQPKESWFALLKNDGSLITQSSPIDDLEDWVLSATRTQVVNDDLAVDEDIDSVSAINAGYPDESSPNSVFPICAAFDLLKLKEEPNHGGGGSSSSASSESSSSSSSEGGGGGGGTGGVGGDTDEEVVSTGGGSGRISFGGSRIILPSASSVASSTIASGTSSSFGQCSYLNDYLKFGENNDPAEVLKLQAFLRVFEKIEAPLSGVFDKATFDAVSMFQERYEEDILAPWGYDSSTGYVYITTKNKINEIFCNKEFPFSDEQIIEIEKVRKFIEEFGRFGGQTGGSGGSGSQGIDGDMGSANGGVGGNAGGLDQGTEGSTSLAAGISFIKSPMAFILDNKLTVILIGLAITLLIYMFSFRGNKI